MSLRNFIRKYRIPLLCGGVLVVLLVILVIVLPGGSSDHDGMVMVNGQWVSVDGEGTGQPAESQATGPGSETEGTVSDQTEDPGPNETEPSGTRPEDDPGGSGSSGGSVTPAVTSPAEDEGPELSIDDLALFSGQYVEDGRDELVENVAAILVTNQTGQFLDLATITYDIDGQTATFVVTGLPAGRSAWVMESSRMTASHSSVLTYLDMTTSFRSDVVASTDKITITSNGNVLTATNNTDQTLENVCVYYRSIHTDGNFFGGITYLVSFGTLEPGASAENLAGHYVEGSTEIVRIGWQSG